MLFSLTFALEEAMLKNLFILILIGILAVIGIVTGFKILHWVLNIAVFVLSIMGILFLIRKLKS